MVLARAQSGLGGSHPHQASQPCWHLLVVWGAFLPHTSAHWDNRNLNVEARLNNSSVSVFNFSILITALSIGKRKFLFLGSNI